MGRQKRSSVFIDRAFPVAKTPEEREQQLIALALDRVEQQIREGSATSPVLLHYLKLETERTKLEIAKLEADSALAQERQRVLSATASAEEKYAQAIEAFKSYSMLPGEVDVDQDL